GVSISNAGGFPACPPFCTFFGTSAATPHSAAVAALLLSKNPTLTPAHIQDALRGGALDIGPAGFDDAAGAGRLDALAAAALVGRAERLVADARGARPARARTLLKRARKVVTAMGRLAGRRTSDLGQTIVEPIVLETAAIASRMRSLQGTL